jgi:hypothetical protein
MDFNITEPETNYMGKESIIVHGYLFTKDSI